MPVVHPVATFLRSPLSDISNSDISNCITTMSAKKYPLIASLAGQKGLNVVLDGIDDDNEKEYVDRPAPPDLSLEVDGDDEFEVLGAKTTRSVWDFPHCIRIDAEIRKDHTWRCGHCNSVFKGWRATKCLAHITHITGQNI